MNTRQALQLSIVQEPDVLAQAIEVQRRQLRDTLHIADTARAQEDWETWAVSARNAADVARALDENLEMQQMQSRATVPEASTASLISELRDRALKSGDKEAQKALKIPVAKKGGARVRG